MRTQTLNDRIKTLEIAAVLCNMIINPVIAWLGNRELANVALFGQHGIVVDTAITAFVASLLVTLFMASGVDRDLRAGRFGILEDMPFAGRSPVHHRWESWTLGLILGAGMAAFLVPLTFAVFHLFNIVEISFKSFLVAKAAYTGLLGFVVARCVIHSHLTPNPRMAEFRAGERALQ